MRGELEEDVRSPVVLSDGGNILIMVVNHFKLGLGLGLVRVRV